MSTCKRCGKPVASDDERQYDQCWGSQGALCVSDAEYIERLEKELEDARRYLAFRHNYGREAVEDECAECSSPGVWESMYAENRRLEKERGLLRDIIAINDRLVAAVFEDEKELHSLALDSARRRHKAEFGGDNG